MISFIFFTLLICHVYIGEGNIICPPVCMIFCENGNVLDSNGCPTCKCKPSTICPKIACFIECPNGFTKGPDGCETCTCAPTVCPPVACDMFCPNGFDKNKFGCDVCACKPEMLCGAKACPAGTECKLVSSGCDNVPKGAQCLPVAQFECVKVCPPVCLMFCEFGNVLDSNGCPTCSCKPRPICPPVTCLIECPSGFTKGPDGCDICTCAPTVCPPVVCKIFCPNGFEKNKDGCDVCTCKPDKNILCETKACPAGFECKSISSGCENVPKGAECLPVVQLQCVKICPVFKCLTCESGNTVDKFGCSTCQCKDPCERNTCVKGEKCVPALSAQRYKCVPACTCPPIASNLPTCILSSCGRGCPRGSICCKGPNGCKSCLQC